MANIRWKVKFPILLGMVLILVLLVAPDSVFADTDYEVMKTQIEQEMQRRVDEYNEGKIDTQQIYDHLQNGNVDTFKFFDSTDPNNIVEITSISYSQYSRVNRAGLEQISEDLRWSHPIGLDGYYYDLNTTVTSGWGTGWEFQSFSDEYGNHSGRLWRIYYFNNEGEYTLSIDRGDSYYISGVLEGDQTVLYSGVMNFDGKIVWCVEPEVPTSAGIKYDATAAEDNVLAAIATIYGYGYQGDNSQLAGAATQTAVWHAMGYGDINSSHQVWKNRTELTEEEYAKFEEILDRIQLAYNAYTNQASLNFTVTSGNAEINENKITVNNTTDKTVEVVLETAQKELLRLYQEGGKIVYPTGMSGQVDVEAGTLSLTIDTSKYKEGAIAFSLIPEDFEQQTMLYNAQSAKQKLMRFGIAVAKETNYSVTLTSSSDDTDTESNDDGEDSEVEDSEDSEDSVNTGDSSEVLSYIVLLALSLAGIVFIAFRKKHN